MIFRIYSDTVRQFSPIIRKAYMPGNPLTESVYLDLENRKLYFEMRGKFQGALSIDMEQMEEDNSEQAPSLKKFWVNSVKLLSILHEYPYIDFDSESGEFFSDADILKVSMFEGNFDMVDFNEVKDDEDFSSIGIEGKSLGNIVLSFSFVGKQLENGRNYGGIAMVGDSVTSSSGFDMFEGKLDFCVDEDIPLTQDIGYLFTCADKFTLYHKGNRVYIVDDKEKLFIYSPMERDLYYAKLTDEEFRKKFDHSKFVEMDRSVLKNCLRFMREFNRDDNTDIYISLQVEEREGDNVLYLKTLGQENKIIRTLPIKGFDKDILEEDPILMHRDSLLAGCSVLSGDTVRIKMDSSAPAIDIVSPEDSFHLVTSRVKNGN